MSLAADFSFFLIVIIVIIGRIVMALFNNNDEATDVPPPRPAGSSSPGMSDLQAEIRRKIAERQRQMREQESGDQGARTGHSNPPVPQQQRSPVITQQRQPAQPARQQPRPTYTAPGRQTQPPRSAQSRQIPSSRGYQEQTSYQRQLQEQMARVKESQEMAEKAMKELQRKQPAAAKSTDAIWKATSSPVYAHDLCAQNIGTRFRNIHDVRRAFIYSEIFSPPLAMRKNSTFQPAVDQQQ